MVGIEPDDSGVAHRRVTSTLHLLGGLREETEVARHRGRRAARPMSLRGSGGNRTHVLRCKRPLQQPTFATDPFVPPSGIEPEPPGLQPGAQTNYARVGCDVARASQATSGVCSWVPARAPFIVINSSVVRERCPGTRGAPRAAPPGGAYGTHLGRQCLRDTRECTYRRLMIWISDHEFTNTDFVWTRPSARRNAGGAESEKGRLVLPGGPSHET